MYSLFTFKIRPRLENIEWPTHHCRPFIFREVLVLRPISCLLLTHVCAGAIPKALGDLGELKVLRLRNNKLTGERFREGQSYVADDVHQPCVVN